MKGENRCKHYGVKKSKYLKTINDKEKNHEYYKK